MVKPTRRRATAPPSAVAARAPLPSYATPFIGRRATLEALEQALTVGEARLLTLLGPAGSGKTRLAVEVAARLSLAFEGRVHLVALRSLEPGGLAARLARAVDVGASTPAALQRALEAQGALLVVLDEAELHLDELAALLPVLLASSASARFLLTSREALSLTHERVVELAPLDKPRAPDELGTTEAGQLFLARLAEHGAALADDPAERDRVIELLGRLGDLPLVVELLAAQVALFGTQPLLARLGRSLDWLATDARDEPRGSLRRALDASYAVLEPAERRVLFACSVFGAPFGLTELEALCDGDAVLSLLRRLRSRSWLRELRASASPTRFALLPPVREYLEAQRARELAPEAHASLRARHAQGVFARALRAPSLDEEQRAELTEALHYAAGRPALHTQARAALYAAFGAFSVAGVLSTFVALAEPLAPEGAPPEPELERARLALGRALRDLGHFERARALLEGVCARADEASALHSAAQGALASLLFKMGRYKQVERQRAGSVPSDRPEELEAFATAAAMRGEHDEALRTYLTALASQPADTRPDERAVLHACFARLLTELGRHERADEELQRAERACPQPGRVLAASVLTTRAMLAHDRGRHDEALARYDEALARYAAPAAPIAAYLAFVRALATLQAGRFDEARAAFRAARSLDNRGMVQLKPLVALGDWVVEGLAFAHLELDDEVVRSTYGLLSLLVERERGADVESALAAAREAHVPFARWSVVSRACMRLTESPVLLGREAHEALLIGAAGRWFAPPGGRVVSIAHRPQLQRALWALAQSRQGRPGARLTIAQLAALLWPGEQMSAQSRKNRVYVAISSLRVLGLGSLLEGTTEGYRLAPDARCELR